MSSDIKTSLAQIFLGNDHRNGLIVRTSNFTHPPAVDGDSLLEQEDSWSIIWYIASFSGLIAFFLIVSCSEWCCRMHVRAAPSMTPPHSRPPGTSSGTQTPAAMESSPPPAYDLFAPPSYDSLTPAAASRHHRHEKVEFDVFVVPVHAIRVLQDNTQDAPPSYISVQMNEHSDPVRLS